jgi:chromosome segregation ATPase
MDFKETQRSVTSCAVLKTIKNYENTVGTMRPKNLPRPLKKNKELRHLEAELGVEKYKNKVLSEEIKMHKSELQQGEKYQGRLKELKSDYELLENSVRRSNKILERQKEEILELKKTLRTLKNQKNIERNY